MTHPTAEIFEILSKGRFISSNSLDPEIRRLFGYIEEHLEELHSYFEKINFRLEVGNEYYYFSRIEKSIDLERKIRTMRKWIDWLDFLKSYDHSLGSNSLLSPVDIERQVKVDINLKEKLRDLSGGQQSISLMVKKLLEELRSEGFIELENEFYDRYKVVAAFNYAEEIVLSINIPEEIADEIPE